MRYQRIASRYAKSLIDFGKEQGNLETLSSDMAIVKEAIQNKDLENLVRSPIIKPSKKVVILKKIFEGSIDKVTMAFLELITKKGREPMLPELTVAFEEQYNKLKKLTAVKLTTASPITEAALASIKDHLLKSNVTDDKVELETAVDADILGGFTLEMGDKLYDASVAHQLDKVKKKFSENEYIKSY